MMKQVNFTLVIMMITVCIINTARIPIAGSFNPFVDKNQPDDTENKAHSNVNLPSLNSIHGHVHRSSDTNETESIKNNTHVEKAGPSLDIIDSHPHSHDEEDNESILDSAKRLLIQPSVNMLDAQLHGGHDHVHDNNQTDNQAADLNDFYLWLKEQNETNQLNRFISLQKEVNQYKFDNGEDLKDKLSRTIDALKSAVKGQPRKKHDL
ncbi:unnamed protein product [Rotaria socialis]|uniref:Uncharacterized protein n=2 Tax=Rotaria socialis TaxID=392032 RepID=A0A821DMA8_9BILA|nr:unnamed protein product [Rotaria socialis]CAF4351331.1 unnamed protein product [Rotaria socialis]CAF4624065.1 unnamed protein product [Rotaria socialis]